MTMMKFTRPVALASALAATIFSAAAQTDNSTNAPTYGKIFGSKQEEISYAIGAKYGADVSNAVKRAELDADLRAMERGFAERLSGLAVLNDDQVRGILLDYQTGLGEAIAKKHEAEGDEFRKQFATQPNTFTTPSGVIYKPDINGTGPRPTTNDVVTANVVVKLADGTEIESSYKNGKPSQFPVNGVLPGWSEALQLMPVGSKWTIVVPPMLGYGMSGAPPKVPPMETLIFEAELLSCKPTPPPAPADLLKSDIVVVPSKAEMEKGAQPRVLETPDEKAAAVQEQKQPGQQTK